MDRFFVRNDLTGDFVAGITLSVVPIGVSRQVFYTTSPGDALFLNFDEAQTLITFIGDMIDWEFAGQLVVVSAEELHFC